MEIKFSHNWNQKLGNKLFSTIRKSNPQKADYYVEHLDEVFEITLKGEKVCQAKLIDIWPVSLTDIPLYLLMLDTGYTKEKDIFKLFKSFGVDPEDIVLVLMFERR